MNRRFYYFYKGGSMELVDEIERINKEVGQLFLIM